MDKKENREPLGLLLLLAFGIVVPLVFVPLLLLFFFSCGGGVLLGRAGGPDTRLLGALQILQHGLPWQKRECVTGADSRPIECIGQKQQQGPPVEKLE